MVLSDVYEDFEEHSGLEFKMLLNEVKKETQSNRARALPAMKTKDEVRDELDEIEKLMEKLKGVSTRAERRRLLAQFNRKQALQYS